MLFRSTLFLTALAANFIGASADVCCQTCELNGPGLGGGSVCTGWGLGVGSGSVVQGTKEECAAMEFYAWKDADGDCVESGAPAMNGDCYEVSEGEAECDYNSEAQSTKRRPLSWCMDPANGAFTHFEIYYNGRMCLTFQEAMDKYFGTDPEVEGDPHFKTFGAKWFDYHGECDLVLLDAPEFAPETPLTVQVRSKLRYEYSYIEAAAISLGEDVLEVGSFGEYALNGVEAADLEGVQMAGYPIYHSVISEKQHKFDIVINAVTNITMTTFKDLVSVKFTAAGEDHFGSATGIMGNFKGELVGRDGSVFENMNEFGQEWQVTKDEPMLFRTARAPQSPQQCALPKPGVTQTRRLGQAGISKEAAEAACSHFAGDQKENCVFDVMAVGDLDMAMAGAV